MPTPEIRPEVSCLLITPSPNPTPLLKTPIKVTAKDIADLKENLKLELTSSSTNILENVDAGQLVVWRCREPKLTSNASEGSIAYGEELGVLLKGVGGIDESKLEELTSPTLVSNLGLGEDEMLLVQVPVLSQTSVSIPRNDSNSVPLAQLSIQTTHLGRFTDRDLSRNEIYQTTAGSLPDFVERYMRALNARRVVNDKDFETLKKAFGNNLIDEHFTLAPPPESPNTTPFQCSPFEIRHILDLPTSSTPNDLWAQGCRWEFVNGLFLFKVHAYLVRSDKRGRLSAEFEKRSPLPLLISHNGTHYSSTPRNDFSIWTNDLATFLRFLLQVDPNSDSSSNSPDADLDSDQLRSESYNRLLLQGASIVRLMNLIRRQKAKPEDSALVLVHIDEEFRARRCVLYQEPERGVDNLEVYYTETTDRLHTVDGRLRFLRVLYNLADALISEEASGGMSGGGKEVSRVLERIKDLAGGIPRFGGGGKSRKREREDEEVEEWENKRPRGEGEGDGDEGGEVLEGAGYEVMESLVKEVRVVSHGMFERLPEVRAHIYYVHRGKEEYVAKRIRHGSEEVDILQEIERVRESERCDNVIRLLDMVSSEIGTFIVLPKLRTVSDEMDRDSTGGELSGHYINLSRDLDKGLTFLHSNGIAHLDINPSNLVYTPTFCLQIIDFDIAVRVPEGEESTIDKFLGTEGWMAPEIGEGRWYSPVKADRYSCGRVFLVFAKKHVGDDRGLREFGERLVCKDPDRRPKLSEWIDEIE